MTQYQIEIKKTADLTALEVVRIMQARISVFVVEQNCPYPEIDEKDYEALNVMMWDGNQLVAYTRIIPHDNPKYISFGRVLVTSAYRKQHFGRTIVQATLDEIKRLNPHRPIKIAAQNYLREFYASFGFEAVSDVFLEDNIPHVDMVHA
ncbi:GNAT family N-acetyltransferase [Weissella kandleri]|uniref:GNAT family N-acetyltransferase n=1 Tax=Weissella kandleri TaxID=1616 RepID=UPI00387EDF39